MTTSHSILLVEDDAAFADLLRRNLELAHFTVAVAANGAAALEHLRAQSCDLVVTDVRMPQMGGLELLRRLKQGDDGIDPDLPVIVLTSVNSVDTAVEAMKLGAVDYITKEADRAEITLRLRKVLEQSALVAENRMLRDQLERREEFRGLVGRSDALERIKREIEQLSGSDATVLLLGETGVGKELVARAIHRTGPQARGPFVDVNCAALPDENLFQSEVFGHEKGAFTDAHALRKGQFELAHRGTLFLDEIAELSRESQGKILKTLESQTITRLGGTRPISVQCRFIFATNKDLMEEVRAGRFREDLYYRINVFPIEIPPLRERRPDIPMLAKFFADQFARKYNRAEFFFEEGAMALLCGYDYPGNIRELRNVIERLVIRAPGDILTREQVESVGLPGAVAVPLRGLLPPADDALRVAAPAAASPERTAPPPANGGGAASGEGAAPTGDAAPTGSASGSQPLVQLPAEGVSLEEVERQLVIEALQRANWNQKEAAGLLGISVDRMNSRVRKFGLKHPAWRVNK